MKRWICAVTALFLLLSPAACGKRAESSSGQKAGRSAAEIDVDLTVLSSTMVYSEVYNMMMYPKNYIGKTVKMSGVYTVYEDDIKIYHACLIADATACCAQGMEFQLAGSRRYPDDYPEPGSAITVIGTFDTYTEGNSKFCQLSNAELVE